MTASQKKPKLAAFLPEVLVRAMCRSALIFLLTGCLTNLPAEAAMSRALGFVQNAQSSFLNNVPAANGTNVVAGDVLSTEVGGSAALLFGMNRIFVPGESVVSVSKGNGGIMASLLRGSVEFNSPAGAGMMVVADDVLVRPKTPQPTRAQVTLLAKDELKIAAVAGPLELELDGQIYTLAAGRTYGVRVAEEQENDQFRQGPSARSRRGLIILVLAATAGVAAIIYLVKELHESPEVP